MSAALVSGTTATFTTSAGSVVCNTSTASGTIATAGTAGSGNVWVDNSLSTLTFTSCSAFGFSATVSTSCVSPAKFGLGVNYNSGSVLGRIVIPSGCSIVISLVNGCQLTVGGAQNVPATYSNATGRLTFTNAPVAFTSNGVGFPCPASSTGQFSATYQLSPIITVSN